MKLPQPRVGNGKKPTVQCHPTLAPLSSARTRPGGRPSAAPPSSTTQPEDAQPGLQRLAVFATSTAFSVLALTYPVSGNMLISPTTSQLQCATMACVVPPASTASDTALLSPAAASTAAPELSASSTTPSIPTVLATSDSVRNTAAGTANVVAASVTQQYELARANHASGPRAATGEAQSFLTLAQELFTQDAWEGMGAIARYASYVDELEESGVENAPGCEQCKENRRVLEKAWQVVANEHYDVHGRFTQATWAPRLLSTLQAAGGTLKSKASLYAAASGMIQTLQDPYSEFLPPDQFRRALLRPLPAERAYLVAQSVGVGLKLGGPSPEGGRQVVAPLASSPAEAAGIRRGDRLLAVDGVPVDNIPLQQVQAMLRGPWGTPVRLTTLHAGSSADHPLDVRLERRDLPQPPVKTVTLTSPAGHSITYLRVHYFNSMATRQIRNAVSKGESDGVTGFVLDLRNDPGGVFEEAVATASLFLQNGQRIASTIRFAEVVDAFWVAGSLPPEIFPEEQDRAGPLTAKPLVVLVNGATASASEVLAGALHDNHRALMLGETTFGKGVIQYYFPTGSDGSGLKLTIAKYLTPAPHDVFREAGLTPDRTCTDYPHGVTTPGPPDECVLEALQYLDEAEVASGEQVYTALKLS